MSTTDVDGEGPPKAQSIDGAPQDEAYAYAEADDVHEVSPTPSPKRSSSDSDEDSDSSDDSELDRMFAGGGDNGGDVTASDAVTSEDKNKNEAAVRAAIASKFTVPTATSPTSTTSTTTTTNNNNNNITKQLSAHWGLVKQAVAVNTTPKDDLWSAIKEAIGESKEDETHRNDKNDTNSSFTFKNFRRELSIIRRSSMESENGSPWTGEDSEKSLWSAGSGDGSYEDDNNNHHDDEDDEDDDEHHYEEELPIFASIKRVGRRLDRKKSLVQSIRRTALTSSTLSSMSGSASFNDFLKLTNDEAAKEWA